MNEFLKSSSSQGCLGMLGLLVAFAALIVALLNWLAPFQPVGNSPIIAPTKIVLITNPTALPTNNVAAMSPTNTYAIETKAVASKTTIAPSGFLDSNNVVNVDLKLFEGSGGGWRGDETVYTDKFDIATLVHQYLIWVLRFDHTSFDKEIKLRIRGVYYDPAGNIFFDQAMDENIWVWDERTSEEYSMEFKSTHWKTGVHTLVLYVQNEEIARMLFTVR